MDALVIDDDALSAELAAEALRGDGYAVEKFHSGVGAVEAIRRIRPRLVLLDIMMPGPDSLSICTALKQDPIGPPTRPRGRLQVSRMPCPALLKRTVLGPILP